MSALRARNDAIIRERKAEQEERDRRELQDRFDAAKTAMETGRTRTQDEAVQEAVPSAVSAEPAPKAEKPAPEAPRQEPPKAPERPQRPVDRPQQRTFDGRPSQRPGQDRPPLRTDRPVTGDRTRPATPYNRTTPPRPGQTTPAPQQGRSGMGAKPYPPRGEQGTQRPGTARPGSGFAAPRRPQPADIMPAPGKERVSNYDPNKKQYVRPNDPERNTGKNKRQVTRSAAPKVTLDDEFERGGKRKRKQVQAPAPKPEPVKIEKAVMTS